MPLLNRVLLLPPSYPCLHEEEVHSVVVVKSDSLIHPHLEAVRPSPAPPKENQPISWLPTSRLRLME